MRKIISLTTILWLAAAAIPAWAQLPGRCQGLDPGQDGDADRAFECIAALENKLDEVMQMFAAIDHSHSADIPSGAVLAFDTSAGCPPDWTPFKAGQGRMLIGATIGTGYEPGLASNQYGDPLAEYKYREHGGGETVVLSPEQLPAHIHPLQRVYTFNYASGDRAFHVSGRAGPVTAAEASPFTFVSESQTRFADAARLTEAQGDNQPHNNMPPYLALYLCKKD